MASIFSKPRSIFSISAALHAALIIYGIIQDTFFFVKYTDIDYFVFTDAATYVSKGESPYSRDTYRYTPLLAWILVPNTVWAPFGKIVFSLGNIIAGWLIYRILTSTHGFSSERAMRYASIWLLNPFVAQISTRGSSEGLLCALVAALLWAASSRRFALAGTLLGLAVHFKIYPFIYGASILWWMGEVVVASGAASKSGDVSATRNDSWLVRFTIPERFVFVVSSITSFSILNSIMFYT